MNYYSNNIDRLQEYFQKGCKAVQDFKIGIEIEHFIFDSDNNSVAYEQIRKILFQFMEKEDKPYYQNNQLLGVFKKDYALSLEPSSQLEISIYPCSDLFYIKKVYQQFKADLENLLQPMSFHVVNCGYNPYNKADELNLIPKKRYDLMDEYFLNTGRYGRNMMRATASTQISIDYQNEEDFLIKYRLALILSPILYLVTDNGTVFEGGGYKDHLLRAKIWEDLDKDRCGTLKIGFDEDFGFRKYAQILYDMPAVIMLKDGNVVKPLGKLTSDCYNDRKITEEELEQIISMVFFDARLKNYIELRMADSMNTEYAFGYMAMIKGLFYHKDNIVALSQYFNHIGIDDITEAKQNLIRSGYKATVYHKKVSEIVDFLNETAQKGMNLQERELFKPLSLLMERHQSPKEMED